MKFNTKVAFWHYLNVDITERYDGAVNILKTIFFCFGRNRVKTKTKTRKVEKYVGLVNLITKL